MDATCYTPANPFWQRIAERLRTQGGLHAPSTAVDDRRNQREEPVVENARETAELHALPFPQSPF